MILRLAWLGTAVRTAHDDHDDVVGRGEIDIVHDQELTIAEARLSVDVGLRGGFGASLMVPMRWIATAIRYLDDRGDEVELSRPGIHHRTETVTGLGDPMVLGWYGRALGRWRVTARAGLTVPIGRTEDNPFVLGDLGLAHQHLQMGTGTFNPVVAVEAARTWGRWRVGGFAFTQQVVHANGRGYQAGDRYAGGVAVQRRLGNRWRLRGGVELQAESAERWDGVIPTDDGNRGRIDAVGAAGAAWSATPRLTVDLAVKVPVVTHVVGGQLDMPAIVELSASWSFGSKPTAAPPHEDDDEHVCDDDHDHDHDDHDHDAADAADLVPVPGKITIFDLWATWCAPCKQLDPVLAELAAARPDLIELRRIDMSDRDDAPILPHVQIYDAAGARVFARSSDGDLGELIEAIRAVLARLTWPGD